jgi:hypothetical protein
VFPTAVPTARPTTVTPVFPTVTPTAHPTTTVTPTAHPTLSLAERFRNVLGIDVNCPRLCWNGINPGVTSAAEARAILGIGLLKQWDDDKVGQVTIENDLVKSIYISSSSSELDFRMNDFIQVLGDPAEIRIEVFPGIECPFGSFFVYYPSRKLTLYVSSFRNADGPDWQDYPAGMVLNTEFDDNAFYNDVLMHFWIDPLDKKNHPFKRQPWLGFGHIHDYLSGRSLPVPCP